jgi:quercetin dioxygenase-like cupin family protein
MECAEHEIRESLIRQTHVYETGEGMPSHSHANWQLIAVLTGQLALVDGSVLVAGESVRIPAGQSHGYIATEPTVVWSTWGAHPNP